MSANPNTDQLGVREAAARIGVHENTVRNMVARGELRVARRLPVSGYARFDPQEVERLRVARQTPGGRW